MATTESAAGLQALSLSLCFLSSACFPLFSQTLAAGSWLLPILVGGACLFMLLIVLACMQAKGKKTWLC